jgi:hypothetical protein
VIFQTSEISYQGVKEVTCHKDAVRRSFAGYYYTHAAPAHWTGKSHSTIFKARPEESVKNRSIAVKRVVMDPAFLKTFQGRPTLRGPPHPGADPSTVLPPRVLQWHLHVH